MRQLTCYAHFMLPLKVKPVPNPVRHSVYRSHISCWRKEGVLIFVLSLLVSLAGCKSSAPAQQAKVGSVIMDTPLTEFDQNIISDVHELTVSPGGTFQIPVTITNPTKEAWSSSGKYPVTVSYIWFENGVLLAFGDDRVVLPTTLAPGASVTLTVKGTAPKSGSNLVVRITMIQEMIAWFAIRGAPSLAVPVKLQ
jgi:hypothetical protein